VTRAVPRRILCALALFGIVSTRGIESQTPTLGLLDRILDTYVRDGFVYYRALRIERSSLDAYLASLADRNVDSVPRDEQIAFWLNAYNAIVLKTVIDQYPIQGRASDFPANSIRQIPGAFDSTRHRTGGRSVTLDEIETSILGSFGDPRVFLALGRGAVGSPRLRSEAFTAASLERQLEEAARECAADTQCIRVDAQENRLEVNPIFSWREKSFVETYAPKADEVFATRSPIERAVMGLVSPELLRVERAFISNNTFEVRFMPFDWTLNDLTGRGGR